MELTTQDCFPNAVLQKSLEIVLLLDFVKVLLGILVGHVRGRNVQLEVRPEVLKVVIVGQLVGDVHTQCHGCFVGPTPVKLRVFPFYKL